MRNWRLVVLLGALVGCGGEAAAQAAAGKIIAPPDGGVYLGAYDFGGGVAVFEQVLGRHLAIGDPYPITGDGGTENTWPAFDTAGHEQNWQAGYVTTYGIESGLGCVQQGWCTAPLFIPQDIIDGNIDSYLIQVAQDIRNWGRPIFWTYPREPSIQPALGYDGGGYGPYGDLVRAEALEQGFSDTGEYGDPSLLDGPERYVDMCRHIHDVVAPIAPNVTWVMGAIVARFPGAYTQWYPGDGYVDWHALDVYAGGEDQALTIPFEEAIEPDWTEALSLAPDKPLMIVEFGVYRVGGEDRSAWFNGFFLAAKTTHQAIGAFIYWQDGPDPPPDGYTGIHPSDPSADDWYNEINGPNAGWWHSSVFTAETPAVPTVSQWGLIMMSLVMLTAGTLVLGRRRTASAAA